MRKLKARDPYSPECGGFGEIPKPTVTVWMGEGSNVSLERVFHDAVLPRTSSCGFFVFTGICWRKLHTGGMKGLQKEDYMQLALHLAESVAGQTSPNPPVGSVVVKNGTIAGMAAHLKAGEKHAERLAVEQAGPLAEGAEVFVTLEPCAHYGKTPPCADFLIEKGIKTVYIAALDPNPLVAGKGIEKLRQAGVKVETGILKEQAEKLYRPFSTLFKRKHRLSLSKPP